MMMSYLQHKRLWHFANHPGGADSLLQGNQFPRKAIGRTVLKTSHVHFAIQFAEAVEEFRKVFLALRFSRLCRT